ncbi:hypothetical protein B9Z55_011385 [Caenorhabditis nigoni]|uniref:Telomere length regulation protein conserved domain-containing protein n=1 Tax=Caenorhabditis nigoni TaxID=1611254 RepID=A0A2G5UKR5_9PELO|nr:hypothetical protein B9Z55_011385 [Caenorhabditis nigoni]
MDLRYRLTNVTERAVLFQIAKDVAQDPSKYRNAVREFVVSLDCFSKFLTDKEFYSILLPILDTQNPAESIIGISKSMATVTSPQNTNTFRDVMTVLQWLKYLVEKFMKSVIFDSLKVRQSDEDQYLLHQEFAKACINLPEKISNCEAKATTMEHIQFIHGVKDVLKTTILEGIQQALITAHQQSSKTENLKIIAQLISAGRDMRITEKHHLLESLISWIGKIKNWDEIWSKIMKILFLEPTELGVQVHESLLTSVFLCAKTDATLQRCIEAERLEGVLRRVVLVKLPFQRILIPRNIKILVNFIHRTCEASAVELLQTAIQLWSDANYTRQASETQERHLVRIILYSVHLVQKSPSLASRIQWNDLFILSMDGIHYRNNLMPTHIQSALYLTDVLCKMAQSQMPEMAPPPQNGNSEEVKIEGAWQEEMKAIMTDSGWGEAKKTKYVAAATVEESPEAHREMEGEREDPVGSILMIPDDDSDYEEAAGAPEVEAPPPQRRRLTPFRPDPITGEQPEPFLPYNPPPRPQLDSDDDEDFPTYKVPEAEKNVTKLEPGEEPRRKVERIVYIQDAFEKLLEKERYEVFEEALHSLKELIEREAIGFADIAEKLFVRLINLQNLFGTKNFSETCDLCAVLCIKHRPQIVPALVRLILSPGQGLQKQNHLLHLIHRAADELGTLDPGSENSMLQQELIFEAITMETFTQASRLDPEERGPNLATSAHEHMLKRTRRFGTRQKPAIGSVNQLSRNAKYMFYPLKITPKSRRIDPKFLINDLKIQKKKTENRKDSDLLAYIIMIASMVYVRCGVTEQTARMSTELIAYAAPHRFSENTKLRSASLAAYLNVLCTVPAGLLREIFSQEMRQEWMDWAEGIQRLKDSTELEFTMAHQMESILKARAQQYEEISVLNL